MSAFIKSMRGSDRDAGGVLAGPDAGGGHRPGPSPGGSSCMRPRTWATRIRGRCPWPWRPPRPWSTWDCPRPGFPWPRRPSTSWTRPKSNAAYLAIDRALEAVRTERWEPVPIHLRDTSYRGAKRSWATAPDTNIRTTIRTITCRSSICPTTWRAGRFTSPATKARRPWSAGAWSGSRERGGASGGGPGPVPDAPAGRR